MSSESRRKSLLAIVEETTEGTPVLPTSGSDFVALQQGFTMQSEPQSEENQEILGVIGESAPIVKRSKSTAEISHYMRHSGVIATEPNFGKLLRGVMGEKVAAHATNRTTTVGSTAGTASANAVLKLGAGGSDYERGKATMYDNTYIRNVLSVSGNDLTVGFNYPTAPVTGKNTGRAILYKPADTKPSFSFFEYLANGLGIQCGAGMKFDSMTITIQAGKPINAKFSAKGTSYLFDPIEITASNNKLDLYDGSTEFNITVPAGVYLDPHDFIQAVESAISSASYTNVATCIYNDAGTNAGKFTITFAGGTNNILWFTGVNTAQTIGEVMGFDVSADDTASLTYTSDDEKDWASPFTPTADSNVTPLMATDTELMIGSRDRYSCLGVRTSEIKITNNFKEDEYVCGNDERTLIGFLVEIQNNMRGTRHDAAFFRKMRLDENVMYQFSAGRKNGSRWIDGSVFNAFSPQMKVTSAVVSGDETVDLDVGLKAFVTADQLREFYMGLI
jgi:hypothetical protein